MLIAQWDAAQSDGRAPQAEELAKRIRERVDRSYAQYAALAGGSDGAKLQYLGVVALGFSASPDATRVLVERLGERDPNLVGNALIALKLRADPDTPLPALLRFLQTDAEVPRRYAPLALANVLEARARAGRSPEPGLERTALSLLAGVVADRDPFVRLHVAKALGALSVPGAEDYLFVLTKDAHSRIQVAAATALARRGDPVGFDEVVRLLHEAPDQGKPLLAGVLATYASRLEGRPLPEADVERMGTSPISWNRWFNEWKLRHGATKANPIPPPPPPRPTGP
jgi:hypothetical protein